MNSLEIELAARAALGQRPTTVAHIGAVLGALGYRLDRSMDCKSLARYMQGPRTGQSYPVITTGIKEADTGRSFVHFESRRNDNFKKLQELRFNQELFAVVRGHILEI